MPQLSWVTGYHRARSALQRRETRGEIAMSRFVHNDNVKKMPLKGQNPVQTPEVHEPDRKGPQKDIHPKAGEQTFLPRGRPRLERAEEFRALLPMISQRVLEAGAQANLEKSGLRFDSLLEKSLVVTDRLP